tara:strand:- start:63 stop:578 length:516 start_codon:yes stop_codon:yes gene_type:complete
MSITAVGGAVFLAQNAQRAEEARKRRMSVRGKDELYIETDKSSEYIGNKLASHFEGWYYKDGSIWQKEPYFDIGSFGLGVILFGFILHLIWAIKTSNWFKIGYFEYIKTEFGAISLSIAIVLTILTGFFSWDSKIDYIKLGKNYVLFKIYDGRGYRNIHEDELDNMLKAIE